MGKNPAGHGYITVTLTNEGIEAIADAVVRKLCEGGMGRPLPLRDTDLNVLAQQTSSMNQTVFMTPKIAAEYLTSLGRKFAVQSLADMRLKGNGPPFIKANEKSKSRIHYRKEDLDAWLDAERVRASTSDTVPQSKSRK